MLPSLQMAAAILHSHSPSPGQMGVTARERKRVGKVTCRICRRRCVTPCRLLWWIWGSSFCCRHPTVHALSLTAETQMSVHTLRPRSLKSKNAALNVADDRAGPDRGLMRKAVQCRNGNFKFKVWTKQQGLIRRTCCTGESTPLSHAFSCPTRQSLQVKEKSQNDFVLLLPLGVVHLSFQTGTDKKATRRIKGGGRVVVKPVWRGSPRPSWALRQQGAVWEALGPE